MKVYIVDDEPLVLASLQATLAGLYETQTYDSAEALLADLEGLTPGVVLADMGLPGMDGGALREALSERGAPMVIVFLTGRGDVPDAVEAMRRGAVDFLCKPLRRTALLSALERAGERLAVVLDERRRGAAVSQLSGREREVLQSLASGAPSKVIAHRLGISPRTVEMHRASICEKLGVPTAGAIAIGCEAGLIRLSGPDGLAAAKLDTATPGCRHCADGLILIRGRSLLTSQSSKDQFVSDANNVATGDARVG